MSDLIDRLRGTYRIPITDGYGPAGGEEPDNAKEFVRTFETPPIQHEAADALEANQQAPERIARLEAALEPFANAAEDLDESHADNSPIWETAAAMSIDAKHLRAARTVLTPRAVRC